ncbi:hypothetical protein D3C87_1689780 [compost metagenome]
MLLLLVRIFKNTFNGQVHSFGSTRCKNNLLRVRTYEAGNLLAGHINRLFGFPAIGMRPARGIPELVRKIGEHLLQDPRVHRGSRIIIQIDGQFQGERLVLI